MIVMGPPLCVSFAGDGTDLPGYYRKHGGAAVSAGINKYVYICLNRKFDNRIHMSDSQTETVEEGKIYHPSRFYIQDKLLTSDWKWEW